MNTSSERSSRLPSAATIECGPPPADDGLHRALQRHRRSALNDERRRRCGWVSSRCCGRRQTVCRASVCLLTVVTYIVLVTTGRVFLAQHRQPEIRTAHGGDHNATTISDAVGIDEPTTAPWHEDRPMAFVGAVDGDAFDADVPRTTPAAPELEGTDDAFEPADGERLAERPTHKRAAAADVAPVNTARRLNRRTNSPVMRVSYFEKIVTGGAWSHDSAASEVVHTPRGYNITATCAQHRRHVVVHSDQATLSAGGGVSTAGNVSSSPPPWSILPLLWTSLDPVAVMVCMSDVNETMGVKGNVALWPPPQSTSRRPVGLSSMAGGRKDRLGLKEAISNVSNQTAEVFAWHAHPWPPYPGGGPLRPRSVITPSRWVRRTVDIDEGRGQLAAVAPQSLCRPGQHSGRCAVKRTSRFLLTVDKTATACRVDIEKILPSQFVALHQTLLSRVIDRVVRVMLNAQRLPFRSIHVKKKEEDDEEGVRATAPRIPAYAVACVATLDGVDSRYWASQQHAAASNDGGIADPEEQRGDESNRIAALDDCAHLPQHLASLPRLAAIEQMVVVVAPPVALTAIANSHRAAASPPTPPLSLDVNWLLAFRAMAAGCLAGRFALILNDEHNDIAEEVALTGEDKLVAGSSSVWSQRRRQSLVAARSAATSHAWLPWSFAKTVNVALTYHFHAIPAPPMVVFARASVIYREWQRKVDAVADDGIAEPRRSWDLINAFAASVAASDAAGILLPPLIHLIDAGLAFAVTRDGFFTLGYFDEAASPAALSAWGGTAVDEFEVRAWALAVSCPTANGTKPLRVTAAVEWRERKGEGASPKEAPRLVDPFVAFHNVVDMRPGESPSRELSSVGILSPPARRGTDFTFLAPPSLDVEFASRLRRWASSYLSQRPNGFAVSYLEKKWGPMGAWLATGGRRLLRHFALLQVSQGDTHLRGWRLIPPGGPPLSAAEEASLFVAAEEEAEDARRSHLQLLSPSWVAALSIGDQQIVHDPDGLAQLRRALSPRSCGNAGAIAPRCPLEHSSTLADGSSDANSSDDGDTARGEVSRVSSASSSSFVSGDASLGFLPSAFLGACSCGSTSAGANGTGSRRKPRRSPWRQRGQAMAPLWPIDDSWVLLAPDDLSVCFPPTRGIVT